MVRSFEGMLTYITLKRAFTGMNPFMHCQAALLGKFLLAYITLKREFTGMTPFVHHQAVFLGKFLRA